METNENFPFGECECRGGGCQCDHKAGPAALSVVRDGKPLKVCTRCFFMSDEDSKPLASKGASLKTFFDYDILGAMVLSDMVDELPTLDPETAGTRAFAAAVGLVTK